MNVPLVLNNVLKSGLARTYFYKSFFVEAEILLAKS